MSYRRSPLRRERTSLGFAIWFGFCAVLGVVWVGFLVWLIIAAVSWLNRH